MVDRMFIIDNLENSGTFWFGSIYILFHLKPDFIRTGYIKYGKMQADMLRCLKCVSSHTHALAVYGVGIGLYPRNNLW